MSEPKATISVVIPVYNESGNVAPLAGEIIAATREIGPCEIVFVDDGSTDGTPGELARLAAARDFVRVVRHDSNRGQSAALRTGVKAAAADIIAVIDGDGQNDPADIPPMFRRLVADEGVRMVAGERVTRRDSWTRRMSSRIANGVRSRLLKDGIRDTGCGIKLMYREDFLELPAFDHMHRFLPALAQNHGGRVDVMPVNHRPRIRGVSKYGVGNRLWVGIVDLVGVMWLRKRGI